MKKEALALVRRIYNGLKFDIPHSNLEEIFQGAVSQAKMFCEMMSEENPFKKEKYDLLRTEIDKLTFKSVYDV